MAGRPGQLLETARDSHPLRVAFEGRDFDGVADALASDVVLDSPITSRFQFEGRDEIAGLLERVREVLEEFEYVDEFGTGDRRTLVFRARVRGQILEGTDVLHLDGDGRVREIKVFVRPLSGLTAFAAALAPRLARERSRARSAAAAAMTRPLAAMTRMGDATAARLVRAPG